MATIQLKLQPIRVPNFIIQETTTHQTRQEGFVESPKFAIAELESETIAQLCDEFRANMFEKAGKIDPKLRKSSR